MTVAEPATEIQIRDHVRAQFRGYLGGPGRQKLFVNEMDMNTTRADLMMVTPHAHVGIEIKSGRDNCAKLERQIPAYELYCDFCWLVIHPKHANKIFLPDYWGLIVARNTTGRVELDLLRPAAPNPMPENKRIYRIASHLWADELKAALKSMGKRGYSKNRKYRNARWLCQNPDRVRPLVYQFMKARGDWRANSPYKMRRDA